MAITKCAECGKELYRIPCRLKERNYCNTTCQANYEYRNGIRDKTKIALRANDTFRKLAKEGKLYMQQPENRRILAQKRQGKRGLNPDSASKYEKITRAHLYAHGHLLVEEYAFDVFNIDFAFPNKKIAVEVNGGHWHDSGKKKEFDDLKKELLTKEGWSLFVNKCPFCQWTLYGTFICNGCGKVFERQNTKQICCSLSCNTRSRFN